jgi:hypothetical protein
MKKLLSIFIIALLFLSVSAQLFEEDTEALNKCDACKFFVELIKEQIPKYQGRITPIFKNAVCAKLQKGKNVCELVVDMFGDAIVKALEKMDVEKTCVSLKLCTKIQEIMFANALGVTSDGATCPICKYIVTIVAENISKKREQIIEILLEQCSKLPKSPATVCQAIAITYGNKIIDWVEGQGEQPEVICAKIRMCPPEDLMKANCLFECLKGKFPLPRIIDVVTKCKKDVRCYISELGSDVFDCVVQCIN